MFYEGICSNNFNWCRKQHKCVKGIKRYRCGVPHARWSFQITCISINAEILACCLPNQCQIGVTYSYHSEAEEGVKNMFKWEDDGSSTNLDSQFIWGTSSLLFVLHQFPRGLILRSAEHLQLLLTSSGVLSVLHLWKSCPTGLTQRGFSFNIGQKSLFFLTDVFSKTHLPFPSRQNCVILLRISVPRCLGEYVLDFIMHLYHFSQSQRRKRWKRPARSAAPCLQ